MKKITLEEHFATREYEQYWLDLVKNGWTFPASEAVMHPLFEKLTNMGVRLADMDAAGIDMQVLSLTSPGVQMEPDAKKAVAMASEFNNYIAGITAKHPSRLAAFATVALQNPELACQELERCITKLGMKGVLINGHTLGQYLDDRKFWSFLELAESLNVPVYLHPTNPVQEKIYEGYIELEGAMWGWAFETSTHLLRLILSGAFDKFPKLTFILGHLGEALPYYLWRLDSRFKLFQKERKLKKVPSAYLKENLIITTSGMFDPKALRFVIDQLGADRILFSIDYPYEDLKEGARFIDSVEISDADRQKICFQNAERLLKLSPQVLTLG
jgi:2,3-dihydroxybenzoate decarboxylase